MEKVITTGIIPETRERLKDAGSKRETYDDVISRLLTFYEKHHKEGV